MQKKQAPKPDYSAKIESILAIPKEEREPYDWNTLIYYYGRQGLFAKADQVIRDQRIALRDDPKYYYFSGSVEMNKCGPTKNRSQVTMHYSRAITLFRKSLSLEHNADIEGLLHKVEDSLFTYDISNYPYLGKFQATVKLKEGTTITAEEIAEATAKLFGKEYQADGLCIKRGSERTMLTINEKEFHLALDGSGPKLYQHALSFAHILMALFSLPQIEQIYVSDDEGTMEAINPPEEDLTDRMVLAWAFLPIISDDEMPSRYRLKGMGLFGFEDIQLDMDNQELAICYLLIVERAVFDHNQPLACGSCSLDGNGGIYKIERITPGKHLLRMTIQVDEKQDQEQ